MPGTLRGPKPLLLLLLSLFPNAPGLEAITPGDPAPRFRLPKWETGEMVELRDFAGQIVVLDFFAYWCAPCLPASTALETEAQQFYASNGGNPHGIPVQVISINIERDRPARTAAFIRRTGASFVLNDFSGALLKEYGAAGIPFLVVLDGSKVTAELPSFRIVYMDAGFEGAQKLRQVIDAVGTERAAGPRAPRARGPAPVGPAPGRTFEAESEAATASDIRLLQTALTYTWRRGAAALELTAGYASMRVDYEPFSAFDFLGSSVDLHEDRYEGLVEGRVGLGDTVTVTGSLGAYSGFRAYRSVWLANYYRQQFSVLPDYEDPDPKGASVSAGARWEYLPANGFLEAELGYALDQVAPGYTLDPDPVTMELVLDHGRELLHTRSLRLSSENLLSRRIRTLNQFSVAITSERQPRYAFQGNVNLALGERWVVRGYGGYTQEAPEFKAHFFGSTVEFEVTPAFFVHVSGRYYTDTGEIENSLLLSAFAPGLESYQAGIGVRLVQGDASLKLFLGPYWTRYDAIELGTRPFTNLYKDRTWGIAQIAYAVQF